MAGLDTSIPLGIKPVDFGDPNEGRMNALRAQMMQMQMQQGQFNMMKAQRDMQYQDQQRAQAAAAAARDKAAEAQAIALYGKTGAPGYQTYSPSMEPGAASDVGMLGGGQGYTEGAVNRLAMPAQPKNFDDAITTALQSGEFNPDVMRKLMALKETENTYKKSNLGVDEATAKTKEAGYKASDAELGNFDKNYDTFRKQAMTIASPQEAAAWTSAMYDNPTLGKMMSQMGMSKEQAVAKAAQEYAADPQKWVAAHMNLSAKDAYEAVHGTIKEKANNPTKLQQLHEYGDKLKANLQEDPANKGLQQQLAEVQANIDKEAKTPGDPNAIIPPNSKLFLEQTQKHEKDLRGVNGSIQNVERANKKIDAILDPKNDKAFNDLFGGYGAYGTQLKSGDTADVKGKLDSLKSELKNAGLNIIRNKGSVGSMTEKEWPIVQDMIDTLSPTMSVNNARQVIAGIRDTLQNAAENDKSVYNGTWGQTQFHRKDYAYVPPGGKADNTTPAAPSIRTGGRAAASAAGGKVVNFEDLK